MFGTLLIKSDVESAREIKISIYKNQNRFFHIEHLMKHPLFLLTFHIDIE